MTGEWLFWGIKSIRSWHSPPPARAGSGGCIAAVQAIHCPGRGRSSPPCLAPCLPPGPEPRCRRRAGCGCSAAAAEKGRGRGGKHLPPIAMDTGGPARCPPGEAARGRAAHAGHGEREGRSRFAPMRGPAAAEVPAVMLAADGRCPQQRSWPFPGGK